MTNIEFINNYKNKKCSFYKFCIDNKGFLENHNYNERNNIFECAYRIINNIENIPKCCICENQVKFLKSNIYSLTCCPSCQAKECQKRREESMLEHFGVSHNLKRKSVREKLKNQPNPFSKPEVIEKLLKTKREKHNGCTFDKDKYEKTMFEKYGVKHNFQMESVQKASHTHEVIIKGVQTRIEKYGSNVNKEKLKQTLKERYNVEHISQIPGWVDSVNKTKQKNGTFNTSKPENLIYNILKNNFKNIKRNFKDKNKYPFQCDFYIPSIDTWIELNFHWTHGGKPYNPEDEECIKQLEHWKYKSENSQFYKNAINTWTVRDINKINIAKQNNLNYLTFYTEQEFFEWFNKIKEDKDDVEG